MTMLINANLPTKSFYNIISTIINNLATSKMKKAEAIRMNKNRLENIIYFLKKAIAFESVPESGPQHLVVEEASIQSQSGTEDTKRDGYITLMDVI